MRRITRSSLVKDNDTGVVLARSALPQVKLWPSFTVESCMDYEPLPDRT